MSSRVVLWAVLCGCGRIAFDGTPDASVDAALGPFETPTPVAGLSSPAEEDDPTLPGDMLEIYFETTRAGGFKVFVATRPSLDAPWSPPVAVPELASAGNEACPEISEDGLTMMFSSDRAGGMGGYDLFIS